MAARPYKNPSQIGSRKAPKISGFDIHLRVVRKHLFIYLFRDESESENFAFSVDMTGANIPPITPLTEWIFLEAINTLKFVEPWDIGDFQEVLEHLKVDGYYLFQGEIIQPSLGKRRQPSPEC